MRRFSATFPLYISKVQIHHWWKLKYFLEIVTCYLGYHHSHEFSECCYFGPAG